MAGKDKDDPKEWTPADPLDDEEDEKETQRVARATARRKHLEESYAESLKKKSGKSGKDETRKGIFG